MQEYANFKVKMFISDIVYSNYNKNNHYSNKEISKYVKNFINNDIGLLKISIDKDFKEYELKDSIKESFDIINKIQDINKTKYILEYDVDLDTDIVSNIKLYQKCFKYSK